MSKILIVSLNKYPDGDAGSVRTKALAKLLTEIGNDVTVIGLGTTTNFKIKENEKIKYTSFRALKQTLLHRVLNLVLFKKRLKELIRKDHTISHIILVSATLNSIFFLKKYSRKHKIQLIHDSVEWYSKEQFKWGKYALPYILKNSLNTRIIDKQFAVIAISNYLYRYFSNKGITVTKIPVVLDMSSINYKKNIDKNKIVIQYAGQPGNKDYLKEALQACALLSDANLSKIEIRLIGIKKQDLIDIDGLGEKVIQKLDKRLNCFGRIKREAVLHLYESADFTFLLRPPTLRYAKAGFPTKFVESLATGTPVICNMTSDLSEYVIDMKNSIKVPNCTSTDFYESLMKAINLSFEQRVEMQKQARLTAEKHFGYQKYIEQIKQLTDNELH